MQVPPPELTQQFPGLRLTLARQMADYRERMATRILEERKSQSLSREALAAKSGVSYKTIKRIEERKNDGEPRAVTIRRLAEGLGIDPAELRPPVEQEEDQLNRIEQKLDALFEILEERFVAKAGARAALDAERERSQDTRRVR